MCCYSCLSQRRSLMPPICVFLFLFLSLVLCSRSFYSELIEFLYQQFVIVCWFERINGWIEHFFKWTYIYDVLQHITKLAFVHLMRFTEIHGQSYNQSDFVAKINNSMLLLLPMFFLFLFIITMNIEHENRKLITFSPGSIQMWVGVCVREYRFVFLCYALRLKSLKTVELHTHTYIKSSRLLRMKYYRNWHCKPLILTNWIARSKNF